MTLLAPPAFPEVEGIRHRWEVLAADIVNLMDVLGLRRAHLLGHSLGGFVAFLVALREPERVDRMIAVGVGHPWPRSNRCP